MKAQPAMAFSRRLVSAWHRKQGEAILAHDESFIQVQA
jgi:hypothetical protein